MMCADMSAAISRALTEPCVEAQESSLTDGREGAGAAQHRLHPADEPGWIDRLAYVVIGPEAHQFHLGRLTP